MGRREEEAQLQGGVQPGGPAAAQHQVLHGGPLLQHHPAARRDAEDHLFQEGILWHNLLFHYLGFLVKNMSNTSYSICVVYFQNIFTNVKITKDRQQ